MTALRARSSAVATALLLLASAAGAWMLWGGGWLVVETPSMGTRAPVGSLVQLERVDVDGLAEGDLVSVRPSGRDQTWTHEVAGINGDGTFTTAGVLSGPDPWRVGDEELVGRATAVVPGVGWLVTTAPLLIGLAVMTALVLRFTPARWRLPVGVVAAAAAIAVTLVAYQPLGGAQQVGFSAEGSGAVGEWVNTGLLPMELTPVAGEGGAPVVVGTGEVARIVFDAPGDSGRYAVRGSPVVPWPVWFSVALGCALPAVVETARRRPTLRT